MLGGGTRSRALMVFALGVLAITVVWLVGRSSHAAQMPTPHQVPRRADAYQGSSGMGADGFGGYPSRPDAP